MSRRNVRRDMSGKGWKHTQDHKSSNSGHIQRRLVEDVVVQEAAVVQEVIEIELDEIEMVEVIEPVVVKKTKPPKPPKRKKKSGTKRKKRKSLLGGD